MLPSNRVDSGGRGRSSGEEEFELSRVTSFVEDEQQQQQQPLPPPPIPHVEAEYAFDAATESYKREAASEISASERFQPPPFSHSNSDFAFDESTGGYKRGGADEEIQSTESRMYRRTTTADPEASRMGYRRATAEQSSRLGYRSSSMVEPTTLGAGSPRAALASLLNPPPPGIQLNGEETPGGIGDGDDHSTSEMRMKMMRERVPDLITPEPSPSYVETCFKRNYWKIAPESMWVILTLLGGGMSIAAWIIDEMTEVLFEIKNDIAKLPRHGGSEHRNALGTWLYSLNDVSGFFLWWFWALFWGLISVSVVKYVAPQAAGSGIEQVRSIMTGYSIPGYLSQSTLFAKVVGLITVQASGLTVGKEGPFVHIACSMGFLLMQLPMFSDIRSNRAHFKQVISAACATGISSTFGSPVGGVLFAVEVTSNVYHTSDYWMAFYTAVFGELLFRELSSLGSARASQIALFPTTFSAQPYTLWEVPVFIILSIICGFWGGYYVKIILGVRVWRQETLSKAEAYHAAQLAMGDGHLDDLRHRGKVCHGIMMRLAYYTLRPWSWAITILTLHAVVNWTSGQFMRRTLYSGIMDFVVSGEMSQDDVLGVSADHRLHSSDWGAPSLFVNLVMFWFLKSSMCVLALSLPVPSGTFIPFLALGLCMGRFFGEVIQLANGDIVPGGYALVGACAFIAGSTGAISTAVIIFEITAQMSFMVPILLAVIVGRQCGKVISPDLYEALQITKNLPNIPPLSRQHSYSIPALELMNPNNIPYLSRRSSVNEIIRMLHNFHRHQSHGSDLFAIVTNDLERHYLASVTRKQLTDLVLQGETTEGETMLDLFSVLSVDMMSPSCPYNTPACDVLYMFELSLCSTMFVTQNCRVVGWLDLAEICERIEQHEL